LLWRIPWWWFRVAAHHEREAVMNHPVNVDGVRALGEFRVVMTIPVYEELQPANARRRLERTFEEWLSPSQLDVRFAVLADSESRP
jgi:hypothetical protein